MAEKSLHSICRWTFNPGKGGFVPGDMRPEWGGVFGSPEMIKLVGDKIAPRLPNNIELGIELHYDAEVDDDNAAAVADALVDNNLYLAMITPGAHCHFGYGGVSSLDPQERKATEELGTKTVDLAYSTLKKAWHPEKEPALIIWKGSFGYDIATIGIQQMYQNLKESIAGICKYEQEKGRKLYIGLEPKPNEGHPAIPIPTVASAASKDLLSSRAEFAGDKKTFVDDLQQALYSSKIVSYFRMRRLMHITAKTCTRKRRHGTVAQIRRGVAAAVVAGLIPASTLAFGSISTWIQPRSWEMQSPRNVQQIQDGKYLNPPFISCSPLGKFGSLTLGRGLFSTNWDAAAGECNDVRWDSQKDDPPDSLSLKRGPLFSRSVSKSSASVPRSDCKLAILSSSGPETMPRRAHQASIHSIYFLISLWSAIVVSGARLLREAQKFCPAGDTKFQHILQVLSENLASFAKEVKHVKAINSKEGAGEAKKEAAKLELEKKAKELDEISQVIMDRINQISGFTFKLPRRLL